MKTCRNLPTQQSAQHYKTGCLSTLRVWAEFAVGGSLKPVGPRYKDSLSHSESGKDYASWVYAWAERFLRGHTARSAMVDYLANGILPADKQPVRQGVREFCEWLESNPVPPMECPLPNEALAADERAIRSRVLSTSEVAQMLDMSERKVRESFEVSRILASKNHRGEWQTTRGDVLDYLERRKRRGPRRKAA